ncbi:MAG: hypothetical protein RBS57_20005 [Desulforhabdus sp.]|jgi:hypothetical protein|nr:hypothetical protein [Desulforhabdus sp.]
MVVESPRINKEDVREMIEAPMSLSSMFDRKNIGRKATKRFSAASAKNRTRSIRGRGNMQKRRQ